jgi:hypothetical protein
MTACPKFTWVREVRTEEENTMMINGNTGDEMPMRIRRLTVSRQS